MEGTTTAYNTLVDDTYKLHCAMPEHNTISIVTTTFFESQMNLVNELVATGDSYRNHSNVANHFYKKAREAADSAILGEQDLCQIYLNPIPNPTIVYHMCNPTEKQEKIIEQLDRNAQELKQLNLDIERIVKELSSD